MIAPEIILGGAIRGGVALALVLLLCARMREAAPELRHLALAGGLLAAVLMPGLSAVLPGWTVAVPLDALHGAYADALARVLANDPAVGGAGPAPGGSSHGGSGASLLVGAWLCGSLLLGVRLLVGFGGLARLRRGAVARGRSRVVGRRITIVTSGAVEAPVVFGLLRPTILLPAHATRWSREERRAVLAHELAHVRRGDAWTAALAGLATALHWPNPLVWITARRMRAASEQACDRAALASGMAARDYGALLVRLARERRAPAPGGLALATASTGLSRRVEALARGGYRAMSPRSAARLACGLVVVAGTLASAHPVVASRSPADRYAALYGISAALAERILAAAGAEDLSPSLAFDLVHSESGFQPDLTSPSGAIGLTQILPETAAWIDPDVDPSGLADPDVNLRLGFRLLRMYEVRFEGDGDDALRAYRFGPASVARGALGRGRALRAARRPIPHNGSRPRTRPVGVARFIKS